MPPTVALYDTLRQEKVPFIPIDNHHVGMYVCGPTVYARAHIGNARPVVAFDVLYRLLSHLYPRVTYVRNITDVDDKIITESRRRGCAIGDVTTETIRFYQEDMASLGALPPTIEPRATDHIPQMISLISHLIDRGHAYESPAGDGHVLFDVTSYPGYGTLSHQTVDAMLAGARVDVVDYKRHPGDFILWKPSTEEQPGWASPWGINGPYGGRGRPGWHIECSAMAHRLLGASFDIHGGGADLRFPHHENERAQSLCGFDHGCHARYWLHNGLLTLNEGKMSKSVGNIVTVDELLGNHKGEVLRYALVSGHYRQSLDWNDALLGQSQASLDKLYGALASARGILSAGAPSALASLDADLAVGAFTMPFFPSSSSRSTKAGNIAHDGRPGVLEALCDDLNTPLALGHLHALANDLNRTVHRIRSQPGGASSALSPKDLAEVVDVYRVMVSSGWLLGLIQENPQTWFQSTPQLDKEGGRAVENTITQRIQDLVDKRHQARLDKDFAKADAIRQELAALDVVLDDGPMGTTWRFATHTKSEN